MKTLEDFISRAKDAANVIGEKAGQFASVSKLNLKVIDLKSQIKSEFETLGKLIYENYGDGIDKNPEVGNQVQSIKALYSDLDKIKNQLAFMKNKILCKSCGNQNEVGSLYCSKCGENLKKEGMPIIENDAETDDFSEFDD